MEEFENIKTIVVGDKFNDYAEGKNAITASELLKSIKNSSSTSCLKGHFVLGQGVNYQIAQDIIDSYNTMSDVIDNVDISDIHKATLSERNKLAHKVKPCNVIIGLVKKISEDNFELPLLVDDNCELLQDHQTGQHIQGIMIIEAFRQAIVAVTEEFYPINRGKKSTLVVSSINTYYNNFLFPLPTTITFNVIKKQATNNKQTITALLEARQNGEVCAYTECEYTVCPSSIMKRAEIKMATSVTNDYLENTL